MELDHLQGPLEGKWGTHPLGTDAVKMTLHPHLELRKRSGGSGAWTFLYLADGVLRGRF